MQTIVTIISIVILVFLIIFYEQRKSIKKLRTLIRSQFGKKPILTKYDCEKIGYHWNEWGWLISDDEKIDDITWNDLEMDHVFRRLNNCNSFVGEQILFSTLHGLPKDNLTREVLESKIGFFATNQQERESVQLLLCGLSKDAGSYYLPNFIANLDEYGINGIWKYRFMQVLLVLSVLPAILSQNSNLLFYTGSVFVVNLVIYAVAKIKYEVHLGTLNGIISVVNVGNRIADPHKFAYEDKFNDLKKEAVVFKKLSHSLSRIQRKKEAILSGDITGLIYDYLIGGTLRDFVKYDQIIRTLKNRQKEFMALYKKIGEIDMAIAIASFRESLPLFCTPIFQEKHGLHLEELYHPLIGDPVCNTVDIDRGCIITGSNASGKSTFIKAVAINIILAQNIHTCMAKKIVLPYARIITSMAVRDDLMSGESYYIKEIKYLKRIIQNLSEERLVICAIDEILRGTNTEERIAASASILRYLGKKNAIAIVASHDIELTQILNETYDNYHFREKIQEKDIVFDYKIYDGATTSKNAIKLLEYVGFPDEIIAEARNKPKK